jgi:CubicO group peptidase (beta-lactamase class C family)
MDSKQLLKMLDDIDRTNINLHSILVLRNGATVLEAYFPPYGPQDRHLLFSVTKSVTSALVGIAVKEGRIKSVDDPFLSYFKDAAVANRSDWKEKITIKDLLNMTSGIEMCDDYMGSRPDQIQFSLDKLVRFEPGTAFDYNPCNSILLSGIIQKTTGKTALAYAQEKLFRPFGDPGCVLGPGSRGDHPGKYWPDALAARDGEVWFFIPAKRNVAGGAGPSGRMGQRIIEP